MATDQVRRRRSFGLTGPLVLGLGIIVAVAGGYGLFKYQKQRNTDRLLKEGRQAQTDGDLETAATSYRQYLKRRPTDTVALSSYVEVLIERLKESPETVGETVRALRRLVRVNQDDVAAHEQLVRLYLGLREYRLAEELARDWMALTPDSVDAVLALAGAQVGVRRESDAATIIEDAIGRMPAEARLYPPLIRLLAADPLRTDDAAKWLDEALRIDSSSYQIHMAAYAFFYRSRGDVAAAQEHLRQAIQIAPDAVDVLVPAAAFYLWRNELDVAGRLLDRGIRDHPDNRALLLTRAAWAKKRKSPEDMVAAADKLVQLADESDLSLVVEAATLYLRAGKFDQGDECIARLAAAPQLDVQLDRWLRTLRGARALLADQAFEAIPFLESVVEQEPPIPWALALLARAYGSTGALMAADDTHRRLLQLSPTAVSPRIERARLALQRGLFRDARAHVEALVTTEPDQQYQMDVIRLACTLSEADRDGLPLSELSDIEVQLERLAATPPADAATMGLLTRCLVLAGQSSRAIQILRSSMADSDEGSRYGAMLGRFLLSEKMYDAVGTLADELIQRFPDAIEGHALRLRLMTATDPDRLSAASDYVDQCSLPAADHGRLLESLADEYMTANQLEPALEALRRCTELLPNDVGIRRKLSRLVPQLDEALTLITRIRRIEGDAGLQWKFERALALQRLDSSPSATVETAELLGQCLQVRPRWVLARLVLAQAQERAGLLEKAAESYRTAIAHNPRLATGDPAVRLVQVLRRLGRFVESDRILDRVAEAQPEAEVVLRLRTQGLIRQRDLPAAAATAEHLLEQRDDDPDLAALTADLYLRIGNVAKAEETARAALAQNPSAAVVLRSLARVMLTQGRTDESETLVRDEATRWNDAAHYLLLGELLVSVDQGPQADQAVDKATELEPDNAAVWASCVDFWRTRGNRTKQLAAARRSIELQGESLDKSIRLAELLAGGDSGDERREAATIVERRLESEPDDARTLVLAAQLAASADSPDLDEAKTNLRRALAIDPRLIRAHKLLISLQIRQGLFVEASDALATARAVAPDDPELLLTWGQIQGHLGNYQSAIPPLRRLLQLQPRVPAVLNLLIAAYERTGQVDRAIEFIERQAPENEWKDTEIILLARLYEGRPDLPRAEALYRRAHEMNEAAGGPFLALVRYYARRSDFDRVHALASQHREQHPEDVNSLVVVGEILAARGDETEFSEVGLRWLEDAAQNHPDSAADATFRRARAYYQKGDVERAVALLEEAVKLAPDTLGPVNDLAWIYSVELDRSQEALALIEEYLSAGGAEEMHLADTHGMVLLRLGQLDAAEERFNTCLRLAGQARTATAANYHLGLVLLERGHTDEAKTYFQRAIDLDKSRGGLNANEREDALQQLALPAPATSANPG